MMRVVKAASPPPARPGAIAGKRLLLGLVVALALAVGVVFYFGVTGGSTHVPLSKPGVGFTTEPDASAR